MLLHSSVFVTLSLPSPTNSSGRFGTVENRITNKEEDLKGTCLKELCPGPPRTKEQSKTLSHWRNWIVFSLFYSHQLYIKNNLMISVCLNRDFSHVCVSQRSSALWQLYFIIIYLFYIFSLQQLALYVSTILCFLKSSFQTYIGVSRQCEFLFLDNMISLHFKFCQIPPE